MYNRIVIMYNRIVIIVLMYNRIVIIVIMYNRNHLKVTLSLSQRETLSIQMYSLSRTSYSSRKRTRRKHRGLKRTTN